MLKELGQQTERMLIK